MKAGFSILLLAVAIGVVITVCQVHNSPIIIQPLASKNYFLYRVYIWAFALLTKLLAVILAVVNTIFYKANGYKLAVKLSIGEGPQTLQRVRFF